VIQPQFMAAHTGSQGAPACIQQHYIDIVSRSAKLMETVLTNLETKAIAASAESICSGHVGVLSQTSTIFMSSMNNDTKGCRHLQLNAKSAKSQLSMNLNAKFTGK